MKKNLMKLCETSRATLLMPNAGNILFKDRITIYKIPALDVISSNSNYRVTCPIHKGTL